MKLRCSDGDLALVIHDDPECAANIDHIVRVRGPVVLSTHYGALPTWLIFPTADCDWRISDKNGGSYGQCIQSGDRIEHPDAWLLPIADTSKDICDALSKECPTSNAVNADSPERASALAASLIL